LVQGERYLLTCQRYIELNPVRASMIDDPSEYCWSSYHHNALGQPDKLIESHADHLRLGTDPAERQAAYRELFRAHIDSEMLKAIRQTIGMC
jgi:REP-associated tyrosine transposase